MAGDNAIRSLLEKMTQHARSAYLAILERWVYEGVIDDPYGEFFIAENKTLHKERLTQDYDAKYWVQRYSLKDGIPSFLISVAEIILTTGKYLNVMRECGHNVQVPLSENSKLTSLESNHHYLECIKTAYDFASSELLNLIKHKYDLVGKLRSLKRYFLLDQVLEPNWHSMHDKLQTAMSVDEVIQFHDYFLQKCLKECLLLLPQVFKKIEKLKSLCLQYAASIQLLVPSVYSPEVATEDIAGSFGQGKSKSRRPKKNKQQLKSAAENNLISDAIIKFEKEFNEELQSLVPILSSNSQAEPFLTHLAQCILGLRSDQ